MERKAWLQGRAPFRFSEKPIRQRHDSCCAIPSVDLICVFDRMARYPPLFIEREYEQSRKLFLLPEFENGAISAEKGAETSICTVPRG